MKRIFTFIMLGLCLVVKSQTIDDVLRYGVDEIHGTARFQAMSGAFGALGGDMSALGVNPAGAAVFENPLFTVTGSHTNRHNSAGYGTGSRTDLRLNSFELGQLGGVFVFRSNGESSWDKIALAINYDMVNNLDNEFRFSGSTAIGLDNYFLDYAQGVQLGPLRVQDGETIVDAYLDIGSSLGFGAQQAFLGFQAGFIDPDDPDDDANVSYFSNTLYNTLDQRYEESSSGFNSKFTLNMAAEYEEFLSIGASLNFHTVLYDRATYLDESGYDAGSPIQTATFDSFLHTEGSGFSFQLGAIARLGDVFRVGGAYQSPTWYRLTDDFSQRANTDFADKNPDITDINFSVINLFESYTIKTPAKYTGSVAVVFGNNGLLSFDYDYQDFSNAELRPTSDTAFASENDYMSDVLGGVSTIRLGGEHRFGQFSLRAGYRHQGSPYKDDRNWGSLTGYSGGFGFSWGPSRLDASYSRSEQDVSKGLYDGSLDTALINRVGHYVTVGYTLQF